MSFRFMQSRATVPFLRRISNTIIPQQCRTFLTTKPSQLASHTTEKDATRPISSESSLFGDFSPSTRQEGLTALSRKSGEQSDEELSNDPENEIKYIEPEDDVKLQSFLNPKPYKTINSLLSPLKRRLYLANVAKNGFFLNKDTITLKDGTTYKLSLTRPEILALEPSIYLRSWRIKSSVKKTNIVLRALKDLPLKKAITQLHFMHKKVSRDLVEMLERGLKDAETLNYKADDLYIAESWVHTDGKWTKRVECKGRGRTGILTSRWVSARFLLKSKQTKLRESYELEARKGAKKVISKLTSTKIRGAATGFYKW